MIATVRPSSPITLRAYQQEAVEAVYDHLRTREDNPCVVIPTGGGKTPVMSTICEDAVKRWGGRVIILAHVKELIDQTALTLRRMAPGLDVGVYSAGLGSRDTDNQVVVAGIQSVYKRACELDGFDLAIIDEAHLIPLDGEGMYQPPEVPNAIPSVSAMAVHSADTVYLRDDHAIRRVSTAMTSTTDYNGVPVSQASDALWSVSDVYGMPGNSQYNARRPLQATPDGDLIVNTGSGLVRLDRATGQVVWQNQVPRRSVCAPPGRFTLLSFGGAG